MSGYTPTRTALEESIRYRDGLLKERDAEIERLERCLNERDDFLGKIGQWEAFVASLPRGALEQEAKR